MKKGLTFILLSLVALSACYGQIMSEENNPIVHPYSVNHQQIKKINNKDISFYLNNKSIDVNSKLFYRGKFAISDDENTFAICDSVSTDNPVTRPFYLYVFCRILEISDGAIAEVMGGYCMEYMRKFPCEFLGNLNSKEYNMPVEKWNGFVAFEQDSKNDFHNLAKQIDKKIKDECPVSYTSWSKIKKEINGYIEE